MRLENTHVDKFLKTDCNVGFHIYSLNDFWEVKA